MFSDVRKSIDSIVSERVSSPFWGAIIISWLVWNWRILVLLFFTSESSLPLKEGEKIRYNKVEYILDNYFDDLHLIWGPLISTGIVVVVAPFLVNGSYWLSLKFKKWRISKRNRIEQKQVLTVEQSLQLRKEINDQQKTFQSLIEEKEELITSLQKIVDQNYKELSEKSKNYDHLVELNQSFQTRLEVYENDLDKQRQLNDSLQSDRSRLVHEAEVANEKWMQLNGDVEKYMKRIESLDLAIKKKDEQIQDLTNSLDQLKDFRSRKEIEDSNHIILNMVLSNAGLKKSFENIMYYIFKNEGRLGDSVNSNHVAYFEGNDIIEQQGKAYVFTRKGKSFLQVYSSYTLDDK